MNNNSYGRNQVVGEVWYLEYIGQDLIKSASVLFEIFEKNSDQSNSGDYFNAINFLASQALELLPKSLIAVDICLTKNNSPLEEIRDAIHRKLKGLSHNLDNIFEEASRLKTALNVVEIKRINNKTNNNKTNRDIFIDEFRFTIKSDSGGEKIIRIKNLEAARYGLFATNRDIGGNFQRDMRDIVEFLKKLSEETNKIRADMITKFDQNHKRGSCSAQ